ncbi:MAG: outer membrane beta-barrel protein [Flavobacteriaceae bacterium]|nr:outer membrane beta-barrel protein [Flavobacteriaceae bacterium]
MKNLPQFILLLSLLFTFSFTQAQEYFVGVKGGVNYDFAGDIYDLGTSIESTADDVKHGANSKMGYHMGVWFKVEFLNFFIRPELVYTQIEKEYPSLFSQKITTQKIDVPIVLGTKLLGPFYLFGGPAFQYIAEKEISITSTQIDFKELTVGLNIGAGVELGNFGLEVRWEKGFSEKDHASVTSISGNSLVTRNFEIDNRPNQLIFGLTYKLN